MKYKTDYSRVLMLAKKKKKRMHVFTVMETKHVGGCIQTFTSCMLQFCIGGSVQSKVSIVCPTKYIATAILHDLSAPFQGNLTTQYSSFHCGSFATFRDSNCQLFRLLYSPVHYKSQTIIFYFKFRN